MDADRVDPRRVLEHAAWARRVARAMVRDEHLADDLAQDALEAGLRRTAEPESGFRAWIRGALRNLRAQTARADHRRSERELRAGTGATPPIPPDALLERIEAHRSVADAVLGLPEPSRSALTLRYYEDLPVREVARVLGISEQAAASRIHRGLQDLREAYRQRMGSDWSVALTPLLGASAGAAPATLVGVTIMTLKSKLCLAGACSLVLLAALGSARWLSGDAVPEPGAALEAARLAEPTAGTQTESPLMAASESAATNTDLVRSDASSGWRLRVVDESGAPIAGAKVEAFGLRSGVPPSLTSYWGDIGRQHDYRAPDVETISDAQGLAVLQPEDLKLAGLLYVQAPGFVWQAFPLLSGAEPSRNLGDHVLKPGGHLSFRLRDGDGRPLSGLSLRYYSELPPDAPGIQVMQTARSDAQGMVRFESLPLGRSKTVLNSPGFLHWQATDLEATSSPSAPMEVVLDRGQSVKVRVEDPAGMPVVGAELFVNSSPDFEPMTRWTTGYPSFAGLTDGEGLAEIGGLEEKGRLYLLVRSGASWTERAIRPSEELIVLRLPALHGLRARILRPDRTPLAGATALILNAARPTYAPEYTQDLGDDGVLAMELPASSIALAIRHPEGSRIWEQEIALRGDLDLGDVILPSAPMLVLDCRDAASGAPVADVTVSLAPAGIHFSQQDVPWREPLLRALWDEAGLRIEGGTVRSRQLFAGRHSLRVWAPGYFPQDLEVTLIEGQVTEKTVELLPEARLILEVRHPDGRPVAAESIEIVGEPSDASGLEPRNMATDTAGVVAFENLRPGRWRVGHLFRARTHAFAEIELREGENRHVITLPSPIAVAVELDAAGLPVDGARVRFRRELTESHDGFELGGFSVETDGLGRARFDCKEPGRYQVQVFAPGLLPQQREVRLDGTQQLLSFSWSGARISGQVAGGDGAAEVVLVEYFGEAPQDAPQRLRSMFQRDANYVAISPWQRFLVASVAAGGSFDLPAIPPGSYWLMARSPGWRMSEPQAIEVTDAGLAGLQLALKEAAEIVVEVRGVAEFRAAHTGKHLRLVFEAEGESVNGNPLQVTADGECRIRGVAASAGTLSVYAVTPEPFALDRIAAIPMHPLAGQPNRIVWDARTAVAEPPK